MISVIRIAEHHPGGERSSAVYEFICSELEDIEKLPTSKSQERPYKTTYPHPGSTCVCTANGELNAYMLGSDDVWHKL